MKTKIISLLSAALGLVGCATAPELAEPMRPATEIPGAVGLVIEASCSETTRTDIEEGKSTWQAGDRITVVYDGRAYEYTAAESGETTRFASTAGIESYDASRSLVAYYPETTVEGVVSIAAEREIALAGDEQRNAACAPLVGVPAEGAPTDGTLHMTFRNIFSVMELRIDAGELESAAESLRVEPADAESFDGWIAFTGTVDPQTLALTPAENGTGKELLLRFAEGVDLRKAQTIKFPVGRFSSPAGLKLTLRTADGAEYAKTVYKTGVVTYTEQNGVFRAKHLAKALYAFSAQGGGIASADDLADFAAAVNAGQSTAPWQNEQGTVVLLDDIDMAEVTEWTPIGAATFTWASHKLTINGGNPFTGRFDGRGHAIRNLKMVCRAASASTAYGLFGAVTGGGVVENLVFDESCSLEVKATQGADCGIAAGLVYDATLRNIVNRGELRFDGAAPDNIRMTIGMVGFAFAQETGATIEQLVNYGKVTATSGGNTKNGATGIHAAGIVGFSTNYTGKTAEVRIVKCDNYGDLTTQAARASGIVAAANRYTVAEECTNYGENVNSFATSGNARIGNITCITGPGSKLIDCVNRGNVICTTSGGAGGIVCLVNADDNAFVGCENYGLVISDKTSYKGTFFGQCNKAAEFESCIAQGDLGTYEGGSYSLVGVNYANYMNYIGDRNANAVNVNNQTIRYYPVGSSIPAEAEFGVKPSAVEFDAQGMAAAVVQLSSVDWDWTVTTDAAWVHIANLDGAALAGGEKNPGIQYVKLSADANNDTEMRRATVTFSSTDGQQKATVSVSQQARGAAFPSKWVFQASTLPGYQTKWVSDNTIPATSGASGYISVVRGEKNAATPFTRTVDSNKPTFATMVEDDYILFSFPVASFPAGSAVEFNATFNGDAASPKYYIVEYLDGGVWKCVEEDLRSATEDPTIRYTYKSSGLGGGGNYQVSTVLQTVRFSEAVTDGEVKIRCRAVGPYTCSGAAQSVTSGGKIFFPAFGFTGGYVQNLGTSVPRDTKKVLCLGNSFSYYSNPVWMLKEIAWREGHYLKIKAHLKGSQSLTQHQSLAMSLDAVGEGGYDYAFLQDQSQNPATYGRDATASILTGFTTLAGKVRDASPACQVVLEQTWAFSASSYGGFSDFTTFDALLRKGAREMAEAGSAWVSPIGEAFREVRAGSSGINLYYTDNKHQSEYGAYLKACVNYLVLFGERFGNDPADCGLDATKAAYLRSVAEQVVLGHEDDYMIRR